MSTLSKLKTGNITAEIPVLAEKWSRPVPCGTFRKQLVWKNKCRYYVHLN